MAANDNVTIFKDGETPTGGVNVNIFKVLEAIKNERWKYLITPIENLPLEEYTKKKKKLPAVTFSGTFSYRNKKSILTYSNVFCVDLDKLKEEDLERMRVLLKSDKYVLSYFTSPSRKGIKILVQVSNTAEHHLEAALQLEKYFEEKYNVEVDASGKDVCRLCFVSYDKELHLKQAEVFPVTLPTEIRNTSLAERDPSKGPVTNDIYYIYEVCRKWVEDKVKFVPGKRNVYRHAIACALNRCGIDRGEAQMLIEVNLPPVDDTAWHQSVRSAYNNRSEHNTVIVYEYEKAADDKINKVHTDEKETKENLDFLNKALVMMRKDMPYRLMRELLWTHFDLSKTEIEKLLIKANVIFERERSESMAAQSGSLESFEDEIFKAFLGTKNVLFYNEAVDDCLGGLVNGNLYGLVGREKAGKSLLAMEAVIKNAMKGIETIYFNLEMSLAQFFARAALMITGVDIEEEQKHGTITQPMLQDVMEKTKHVLNGKVILAGNVGVSANEILLFVKERIRMGFSPKMIIVDGIGHLSQPSRGEIDSVIENSKLMKQVAKDVDLPIVLLMHTTSTVPRHARSPIDYVRGAMKTRANLDAFINISVCIDAVKSVLERDPPDIQYLKRTAYLRVHNARGNSNTIDKVFKLNENLNFIPVDQNPMDFEVNLKPSRR